MQLERTKLVLPSRYLKPSNWWRKKNSNLNLAPKAIEYMNLDRVFKELNTLNSLGAVPRGYFKVHTFSLWVDRKICQINLHCSGDQALFRFRKGAWEQGHPYSFNVSKVQDSNWLYSSCHFVTIHGKINHNMCWGALGSLRVSTWEGVSSHFSGHLCGMHVLSTGDLAHRLFLNRGLLVCWNTGILMSKNILTHKSGWHRRYGMKQK